MKKTLKTIGQLTSVASLVGVMVLTSCGSDKDSPGTEYMPDMYRSPSIEPFVDYAQVRNKENYENQKNQLSAMTPAQGTIPFYGADFKTNMPFPYYPSPMAAETHGLNPLRTEANGYARAGEENPSNPVLLFAGNQKELMKEAKHLYENNCIHCHGEKGDGKGSIVASGAYSGVPNYGGDDIKSLTDGQLMYSISYGKGMMGAHASILSVEERWKLVHYVRALQNGGKAQLDMNIGIEMADSTSNEGKTGVLKDLYFNTGKASINAGRNNKSMYALLNFMSANEAVNVELAGHTDNTGNDTLNVELSKNRAETVKSFLVEYGINADRVSTVGYGSSKPIADNATVEGRATNRRTEVKILN